MIRLIRAWRYAQIEGEYCRQIESLAPTKKQAKKLNLPAIRPLKAQKETESRHVVGFTRSKKR